MKQPAVSLIRARSYEQHSLRASLETLIKPLGGIEAFVKAGDRVLLKPNLLTSARFGKECKNFMVKEFSPMHDE